MGGATELQRKPGVRIAGAVAALAIAGWAAVFLYHRLLLIYSFNFNIEGIEELFSYLILKIPQGQIYTDPDQYPFIVTQYPPIYLYLTEWLSHFSPLYPEEFARAMYIGARWVNLLCNLLCGWLFYRFLRRHTEGSVWVPLIMAIAVFQLFTSHHLAVRPDSLKLLFMTLMYLSFLKFFKQPTHKGMAVLLLWSVLAVLTKQDALIHIGGLAMILFFRRHFVYSVFWVAASCAIVTLCLLPLFSWDFHLIYKNLVGGIAQGVSWDWLGRVFEWNYPGMILMPLLFIWVMYRLYRLKMAYVIPGALVVAFMTFSSLLKWGSNFNYLTEVQLLLVLFVMWDVLRHESVKYYAGLVAILAVFYGSNHIHNYQYFNREREAQHELHYRELRAAEVGFERFIADQNSSRNDLITFDRPLSLLLIRHTFIGTLVNEYPEIFFETDVHKLSSVPEKVFDYELRCGAAYMENLYFYCEERRCPSDSGWLQSFAEPSGELALVEQFRAGNYICYKVICP